MTENLNNHIDTEKNLELSISYGATNDNTVLREAEDDDLGYNEAEEDEPYGDEKLISSQRAYLEGHFPNRPINFDWSSSADALGSKVFDDSTGQPSAIVSSGRQGDAIIRDVSVYAYDYRLVQSDDDADGDIKEEAWLRELVGAIPADDPEDRFLCHIFFHDLGMAARCRKRGTAFIFDIRGFWIIEYPLGGVSYVGCYDGFARDDSDFFVRVCYEESGACRIVLPKETAYDEYTYRVINTDLLQHLLAKLNEVAATLRKLNL